MVYLTPRFVSLLTFVVSSSTVFKSVSALPQDHHGLMAAHGHHHHGRHGHHGYRGRHRTHHHGSGRTKVYAGDPLIVSGENNHVHAHLNNLRRSHHGGHRGHHTTKVYSDDPLVVSGNGNHIHAHSHKRGIVDPLIPLLSAVPGIPGIIDLVNMSSHAVLGEKLASLIISSRSGASALSVTEDNESPNFILSASNTSSSIMYLLPVNISAALAPPEKPVLVTMPMFHGTEKSLMMYCASYDPSTLAAIQMSSEPCFENITASTGNSTPSHTSQTFSWNTQNGAITPMWGKDPTQPLVDTTSAPGGAPDPASQGNGFVVGQSAAMSGGNQESPSTILMVFHAVDASSESSTGSMPTNQESVSS